MLKELALVLAVLSCALSASRVQATWSFVEPSSMLPTDLASASVVTVGGQKTLIVRELSPTRVWHLVRNGLATRLFGAGDPAPGGGTFQDADAFFGSIQAERVVFSASVFVDPTNQPGVTATRFYRWEQGTLIHLPKPDGVDYDLSKHDGNGRFLASRLFSSPASHWITDGITDTASFTPPVGQFITLVGITANDSLLVLGRSETQTGCDVAETSSLFFAGGRKSLLGSQTQTYSNCGDPATGSVIQGLAVNSAGDAVALTRNVSSESPSMSVALHKRDDTVVPISDGSGFFNITGARITLDSQVILFGETLAGQQGLFIGPTANDRFGGDFVEGFGQEGQVESLLSFHESGIVLVTARLANNALVQAVGTSTVPEPEAFVWTGAESSAYNHGPNWRGGVVPGAANAVQLGDTTSLIVLDTTRSHPGLSLSEGGDHHLILSGETYGIGAEGIAITGGRLTVSNGTLDASGQNTRVGSAAGITARMVIAEGGATRTTFKTGNLLVGHTGDGEVQIGKVTVNVGTVLTLGATPNAKGALRLNQALLEVAGGAAIGIPPGSGSQIIAENESALLWNKAAVATFDHASRFEVRGLDSLSVGGKFVFRGGARLRVENKALFETEPAEDALVLDDSIAEFVDEGDGQLGKVRMKNGAVMRVERDATVAMEGLSLAEEGHANLSVNGGRLVVESGSVHASDAPRTLAGLSVADGLIRFDVDSVHLGDGQGAVEVSVKKGGTLAYADTSLIDAGGGGGCSYSVVDGGTSQSGSFAFEENSRLLVEGTSSVFQSIITTFGVSNANDYLKVSARFRNNSASDLGTAVLGHSVIEISGGATVQADGLGINGALLSLNGANSLLDVAQDEVVHAPVMDLFLGEGTLFRGGTLELGGEAAVFGKGTLAFTTVNNNGGIISPGFSPGILTINGSLNQTAGRIVLEVGGTEPGISHDQIVISGDFNFTGGVIELVFTDGFAPQAGQNFEIMDIGGASTGTPVVNVRGLQPGWDFAMVRNPETGVLKVNSLGNGVALPPIRVPSFTVTPAAGDGPGKRITASVTGPPDENVVLEATQDMLRWFPVANGAGAFNGSGQASFDVTDAEATESRRFYRFVSP
jgi:hypothetical protein